MNVRCVLVALLLSFAAASWGASPSRDSGPPFVDDPYGLEATRAAQQALQRVTSGAPLDSSERRRVEASIENAARLQLAVERGESLASAATLRYLENALAELGRALATADRMQQRTKAIASATITGKVFDAGSTPLQGIPVVLRDPFETYLDVAFATTDATGTYSFTVPAGTYLLRTSIGAGVSPLGSAPGFVNVVHSGIDCGDTFYCSSDAGTYISVADTATLTIADMHLPRAGGISGRVTRASDGTPLAGSVTLLAVSEAGGEVGRGATSATVGMEGTYQFSALAPGRYRIVAMVNAGGGLADTVWSSPPKRCAIDFPQFALGPVYDDCLVIPVDYVVVNAGVITPNIDMALGPSIQFSGVVRDDASGNPLAGARVTLLADDDYSLFNSNVTDGTGVFGIPELRPGSYRAVASAPGYTDRVVGAFSALNVPFCARNVFVCRVAQLVQPIAVGATIANADIRLQPLTGASIAGRVTRASDGMPVAGNVVTAANLSGVSAQATTDANGNYTITGLPDAYVQVFTAGTGTLTPTAYPDVPCQGSVFFCNKGATVRTSSATPLTGVDIVAATAGSISGVIRDAASGLPAARFRTRIEIWPVDQIGFSSGGNIIGTVAAMQTLASGYTLNGVVPGDYYVTFLHTSRVPLIDQGYLGPNSSVDCPRGGCDLSRLTRVRVTAGATTTGIDGTLPRGSRISGRLIDAATGAPLPTTLSATPNVVANLIFNTSLGRPGMFANPDGAGNYTTLGGVGPGLYFGTTNSLRQSLLNNAARSVGRGYVDVVFGNAPCPLGACGATAGNAVPVGGADLVNVNFAVSRGATISGTVRRSGDDAPLRYVLVGAYDGAGKLVALRSTDVVGGYTLDGLPTGTYYVTTSNELGYLDRAYNNMLCEPFCNPVASTAIAVTQPNATAGIDFVLDRASSIVGTVRNGGAPAGNVSVELYGALGNLIGQTSSAADGSYRFEGLSFNVYYVRTRNSLGAIDSLYSALPCVGDACRVRAGTAIDLSTGNSVTGIDLDLTQPGAVGGTVTDQSNGNPIVSVGLQLLDARGAVAFSTRTNGTGSYTFDGLASGSYYLVTRNTPGFVDETSDGQPCPESCSGIGGAPLAVAAGATTTANFQLSRGGSISGSVKTAAPPGAGISPSTVEIYDASGRPVGRIPTSSGNYQLFGLPDGMYRARTQNALGFVDRLYNNFFCSGYCDVVNGTPITITGGVSNPFFVDFFLSPGGSISGTVRSTVSPFPGLPAVTVQAYDINGLPAGSAETSASGSYTVAGLRSGQYRLRTLATSGFVNQVYSGKPCSPSPCDLATGNLIGVGGGGVGPFDFNLVPGATISGTATDRFRNPLPTGTATLYSFGGVVLATAPVAGGRWEFNGLANGSYFVLIANDVGLVDQLYSGVPCAQGSCNITALGTPIVVGAASRVAGGAGNNAAIDFELNDGALVSGRVTGELGAPLAGETVYVFDGAGRLAGDGSTDALGNYTIGGGLVAGTYYAATTNGIDGVDGGYINELFGGMPCPLGCNVLQGSAFTVPASDIDFSLGVGVGFSGTVTDDTGAPVALVTITVVDASGTIAGTFDTDSLGNYSATGLPAGTYYARTTNVLGLIDYLFGGAQCVGNCNVLASDPITTASGNQPQDVDFVVKAVNVFGNGFE